MPNISHIFDGWNQKKQDLHASLSFPEFEDGEIWWVAVGQNVATEVYGKGSDFLRPVVVLRKVFDDACVVIPLTSKTKKGSYYHKFIYQGVDQYALLLQVKYLDARRFKRRFGQLNQQQFSDLQRAFITFITKQNNPTLASGEPQ